MRLAMRIFATATLVCGVLVTGSQSALAQPGVGGGGVDVSSSPGGVNVTVGGGYVSAPAGSGAGARAAGGGACRPAPRGRRGGRGRGGRGRRRGWQRRRRRRRCGYWRRRPRCCTSVRDPQRDPARRMSRHTGGMPRTACGTRYRGPADAALNGGDHEYGVYGDHRYAARKASDVLDT